MAAKKKAKASKKAPAKKFNAKKPRPAPKRPARPSADDVARSTSGSPAAEARIVDLEMQLAESEQERAKLQKQVEDLEAKILDLESNYRPGGADHERGPPKLGYERVDGKQVPNTAERHLVRLALKLRAAIGNTRAAEKLNEKGALLRGKPWTKSKMVWAQQMAAIWDKEDGGGHVGAQA